MQKVNLMPINGALKSFKVSNHRVVIGSSTKNKTGKKYNIQKDMDLAYANFRSIIDFLPNQPFALIVSGIKANTSQTLSVIVAQESIRVSFLKSGLSFQNLLKLLDDNRFDSIQLQLAKAG